MAIEKKISLTLETGDTKKRLKDLQDSINGVDKKLPKKGSDPFAPVTTSAKKGRKTILDYSGALSNADRIVKQSAGTYSLVEKQALKHDTALRKLNKAYEEGRIDVTQYNKAVSQANAVNVQATSEAAKLDKRLGNTSGFKVMRGSLSQLSYQLQDIAVQAQMGTNAFIILGQQGPQIASLLGPFGAVLGVVIAVGAAVGGTALTAFFDLEDAGKKLEKQMDSLSDVIQKTADGAFLFSDSIVRLKQSSDSASNLRVALAIVDAQSAIETASKGIVSATKDVTNSIADITDVDYDDLKESFEVIGRIGVSSFDELKESVRSYRDLTSDQRATLRSLKSSVEDVASEFGISKDRALEFLQAIDRASRATSASDFQNITDVLNAFVSSDLENSTKKQSAAFVRLASDLAELADKGATAAEILDRLTEEVSGPSVAFSRAFSQNTESVAMLNSSLDTTASLIIDINNEYARLNELQIKDQNISGNQAANQARQNSIQLIADEISSLDTYAERQRVVNSLIERSSILKAEDGQAALDAANEQNFVYREQTKLLTDLLDKGSQLGDIYNQGAKDYVDSVGTYNEGLQGLVTSTFSSMEDAIVSFAETGKFEFADFAKSVLSDLLRIQTQQALAGLAGSFSFAGGTTTTTTTTTGTSGGSYFNSSAGYAEAKGGVWGNSGRLSRYAQGGITGMVNTIQSTPKYFANGGGLLGESAQSEAILPLTRTSGGDLGVKTTGGNMQNVNINITNETGTSMELEETGRSINSSGGLDINVIAKGINQVISSGRADQAMKTRFNLTGRAR